MTPSARYTCNHQLAGYSFECRDEMGAVDFHSFAGMYETFPWGEQMRQREKMAGGCSATISVEDHEANLALWVSVMGDDRRPTYLLGVVWDLKARAGESEPEAEECPCDIWIAPSRRSALSAFRILFAGDIQKLERRLSSYRPYDDNSFDGECQA